MRNELVRMTGARPTWAIGLGAVALLVAGCNQVGTQQLTFWDIVWSMVIFFFWVMVIWIFIAIFGDLFRRTDLSGGAKALWILAIVILPFLGALIYIAMRPKVTAQDVQMMAQADAANKALGSKLWTTGGLDIDAEIDKLVTELQGIFDSATP